MSHTYLAQCDRSGSNQFTTATSDTRDDTDADAKAFARALVDYEQPWEDRTGFENCEEESRNRNLP